MSETAPALFQPGSPRVFTMPPGAGFLGALARTLAETADLENKPDALADALIYVPNRRSARALALALHKSAGTATLLPPDIRALGDLESPDAAPTGAEEALAELGPALDPNRRLGELARLVMAFYIHRGMDLPASSAVAAARELIALLDQAALSDHVDWSILPDLAQETDLAGHWADSAKFLEIVTTTYPEWLREIGAQDPFQRRLQVAEALADLWLCEPPAAPVIIAGSTGATPASRVLMQAAAALPRGCVVLPGLDREAGPDAWAAIAGTPSHPQHALRDTLSTLGIAAGDVAPWPGATESPAATARRRLIHESLAPANDTADWLDRLGQLAAPSEPDAFAEQALRGLTLMETADEMAEAQVAALLMRQALEVPGRTTALVTPDAGLARQVSALLKRWDIHVAPSSGTPLLRTAAGSFLALVAEWLLDPGDPVALSAVAKHALVGETDRQAALEMLVLRGPRRWAGLERLRERLDAVAQDEDRPADPDKVASARALLDRMGHAAGDGTEILSSGVPLQADNFGRILTETIDTLCPDHMAWSGSDGVAAGQVIEALGAVGGPLGALTPRALVDLLLRLADGVAVPADTIDHPRLAIWGPLEARLQSADRIILAGLNEGVWPNRPPADAFLPRKFRKEIGLNDPEDRLGLAAHDFAQLACAPDVVMLRAKRRDDAPAVASRWVWRLQTLARGALRPARAIAVLDPDTNDDPRVWMRALQTAPHREPGDIALPNPRPPIEARPNRLSVTRVDDLQRDPYAIYARMILRLEPLEPLNGPLDARQTGTAIHDALDAFETDGAEASPERLLNLIETSLIDAGLPMEDILSNRAIRRRTIDWYLAEWRAPRLPFIKALRNEKSGRLDLDIAGAPFALTAKADRIELRQDGTLAILDFKTGRFATDAQISAGLDQQMPLQALIAQNGGFDTVPAATVSELGYVSFKSAYDAVTIGESPRSPLYDVTPGDLAETARAGLSRLINGYRKPETAYLSAPRVQFIKFDYGYNRLARRDEWTSESGND